MKKLLIGLFIPATQEHLDVFVPAELSIEVLTKLLSEGVVELCHGRYVSSGKEMLVRRDPDILLNPGETLSAYGIKDGTQLVLI